MNIEQKTYLDFSDVLIKPKRSKLNSRSEVDLWRNFQFRNCDETIECVPICAANMSTTGCFGIAKYLSQIRLLSALHKHYAESEYSDFFVANKVANNRVFYSMGSNKEDLEKLRKVVFLVRDRPNYSYFPDLLMIDVANAYCESFVDFVKKIRDEFPDSILCCGNIATPEMTEQLILSGADIVKVGIGPGAVCKTRMVAGVGIPQLSSIIECADAAHGLDGYIMADGGINCPADAAKAFGAGADFIMLGTFFAGAKECEGEWIKKDNKRYLKHFGMASREAMEKYNGVSNYRASEGECIEIEEKGSIENIVQELLGGIRSACSYTGSARLKDLPKCTTFIKVNKVH